MKRPATISGSGLAVCSRPCRALLLDRRITCCCVANVSCLQVGTLKPPSPRLGRPVVVLQARCLSTLPLVTMPSVPHTKLDSKIKHTPMRGNVSKRPRVRFQCCLHCLHYMRTGLPRACQAARITRGVLCITHRV